MSGVVVQRWRKYGKDRLYVNDADGTRIGWLDVATGVDHIEVPGREVAYREAVDHWRADALEARIDPRPDPQPGPAITPPREAISPIAVSAAAVAPPAMEPTPVAATPWEDLAARRAGAMARDQAIALKQAAPVRTFVARVLGVHTQERAWRIGADGEEKVAAQLTKLAKHDPRWRFLHAIPVGEKGADIDHLVIGPGGAFTLNAKHHPGARIWIRDNAFRVNNTPVHYIRNSRHEARRAGRNLTLACGFAVSVAGIIVPVGADSITIKEAPADVHVVNRMGLADWLRRQPLVLDDTAIAAIFDAARRSATWHQEK